MTKIMYNCPNCNAALVQGSAPYTMKCEYCGGIFPYEPDPAQIALDTQRQAEEDASAFLRYMERRHTYENEKNKCDAVQKRLNSLRTEKENSESAGGRIGIYIFSVIMLMLAGLWLFERSPFALVACVILALPSYFISKNIIEHSEKESYKKPNFLPVIISSVIVLISVGAVSKGLGEFSFISVLIAGAFGLSAVLSKAHKHKLEELDKAIIQTKEELKKCERNAEISSRCNHSEGLRNIPEHYRDDESLEGIYEQLGSKRARTIPDAVRLYEDKRHRDRIEAMNREQLELQRQQLESTRRMEENMSRSRENNEELETLKTVGKVLVGVSVAAKIFKLLK